MKNASRELRLQLLLERADDRSRRHRAGKPEPEPREPVPEPPPHCLLGRRPGHRGAREEATEAGEVLFVLELEDPKQTLGGHETVEPPLVVDDGQRAPSVAGDLARGDLQIGVRPHGNRGSGQIRKRRVVRGTQHTLDRCDADESLSGEDGDVGRAREGSGDQSKPRRRRRRARLKARDVPDRLSRRCPVHGVLSRYLTTSTSHGAR